MSEQETAQSPVPRRRRGRWLRSFFFGGVILSCGILIGIAITSLFIGLRVKEMMTHPEIFPERIVERLDSRLDLSDDQKVDIDAILQRHMESLLAIRNEVQPKIMADLTQLKAEIEALLTPEQTAAWQRYFEMIENAWATPGEDQP